jgi:hypothetical protein
MMRDDRWGIKRYFILSGEPISSDSDCNHCLGFSFDSAFKSNFLEKTRNQTGESHFIKTKSRLSQVDNRLHINIPHFRVMTGNCLNCQAKIIPLIVKA